MNYHFSLFPIVSTVLKAFEEETHEVEKSNNYRVDFPNPITLPVVPNQGVYPQVNEKSKTLSMLFPHLGLYP